MAIYFDSESTDSLQHYEEGTFTLTLSNTSGGGETRPEPEVSNSLVLD